MCSFHLDREAEVKVVYLREIQRPEKAGRLEKNQEKPVFFKVFFRYTF